MSGAGDKVSASRRIGAVASCASGESSETKDTQVTKTTGTKSQLARRGVALVEMALVLPIFITVVLGIVEFGRAMMVSQLVTNAAREGARLSIIDGTTNTDVQSRITTFLQNAINAK